MDKQWRKTTTVLPGGRLDLDFPDLVAGDLVEVSVTPAAAAPSTSILQFGRFCGQIRIAPDFDAPLDDFREYT